MARLYLVRHGVHDLVGKVLAGRMPGVSLSAEGRNQAAALAAFFAGTGARTILSSPLDRCEETAAPIAARLGVPVEQDEALNEIDCGVWTGASFDQLNDDPRWRAWNSERGQTRIPNGESIEAVQVRVMALVTRVEQADRAPTVLVTHSDVIKVVLLTLLGASLDSHDRLEIDPASTTTIDLWPGGGKILRCNEAVAA